jgi:tripartite ATP-independent transporter DctP family solute receptor
VRIVRSAAAALTAAAVLAFVSPSRAEPITLTIGTSLPADHTASRAMEIFKAEVTRRSHHSVIIDVLPDMALGGGPDIVQKVRADNVFGTWNSASFVSKLVPEVEVMNLPFVFSNYDGVHRTLEGPVGKLIESKLDAKGFTLLCWMDLGARNVMNAKRPLKTVADFKDLKIRVQPSEIYMATFRALGAVPLATDPRDIRASLRQGDLDGIDTPYSIVYDYKYHQYMKYVSDTNSFLEPVIFIVSKNTLMRLTPEQQKAVWDAAKVAAIQQRKMEAEREANAFNLLLAEEQQFDPMPPETRIAMRNVMAGVITRLKNSIDSALVDKVVAEGARDKAKR